MEDDNTAERWKKTDDYDYFVSTCGRVKNKKDCIMKQQLANGYYRIDLYNKKRKSFGVNILVATAFVPNPHNLPQVDHINTNRKDNRASNLRWVTAMENTQSVNKTINIGCVSKNGKNGFQAQVRINGTRYYFSNVNEDKCLDWLYARRIEIKNELNLTELDIKKNRNQR